MFNLQNVIGFIYKISHDYANERYESSGLTNLKLQKILYYFQALTLSYFNKPLFQEKIENWKYGPVVTEAYKDFSVYTDRTIQLPQQDLQGSFDPSVIINDKIMNEFLTDVFEHFSQYSAWNLSDKTHAEDPWSTTSEKEEITHEKIKDFFNNVFDGEEESDARFEYIRDFEDRKLSRICKEALSEENA